MPPKKAVGFHDAAFEGFRLCSCGIDGQWSLQKDLRQGWPSLTSKLVFHIVEEPGGKQLDLTYGPWQDRMQGTLGNGENQHF